MKNNRFTNNEIIQLRDSVERIRDLVERIRDLSSLQICGLDDDIKTKIRPYLMWFEVEAMIIETILDSDKF